MARIVTCEHCGERVEAAAFCSQCGKRLVSATVAPPRTPPASQPAGAARDRLRSVAARAGVPDRSGYGWIVDAAVVLIVLALLAARPGLAILIGVFIVPLLALRFLAHLDLFEKEPWYGNPLAIAGGMLAGVAVGAINQFLTDQLWIDDAPLNIGAAGFGGRFAEAEGRPSILLIFTAGMLMPAVAALLQISAAGLLRRYKAFRNEVMDGVTLGAAAGFGFSAATAIVYYWPLIDDGRNPNVPLEDWTATLLGLAVVRPLIFGTSTALIGAGIWHATLIQQRSVLTFPVVLGVGAAILYSAGDLVVQPSGARWELLWGIAVLAVLLVVAFRFVLRQALEFDQRVLGPVKEHIVCPHCGQITPRGAFCAVCGRPLATAAIAPESAATADAVANGKDEAPIQEPAPVPPADPEQDATQPLAAPDQK